MGKPTEAEFKQALAKAAQMREQGEDPDFVAKSLLSLNYRFDHWQRVINAMKLYLRSGMATTEHARLIKVLHEVETIEQKLESDPGFGLE